MLLRPHLQINSVTALTPARLSELGLTALLLDVDSTLKPYRSTEPLPEVAAWIETLRAAGIGMCLVSNGRWPRIKPFAETVGLPFVAPAMKPLPSGCRRAVREMNFDSKTTAMVGDQVFADVMAARLAGLMAILVRPIRPEEEPWFARMKRPLERLFLPKKKNKSLES